MCQWVHILLEDKGRCCRSPGAGIWQAIMKPVRCWELNWAPLQEQYKLLTIEPSLHSLIFILPFKVRARLELVLNKATGIKLWGERILVWFFFLLHLWWGRCRHQVHVWRPENNLVLFLPGHQAQVSRFGGIYFTCWVSVPVLFLFAFETESHCVCSLGCPQTLSSYLSILKSCEPPCPTRKFIFENILKCLLEYKVCA